MLGTTPKYQCVALCTFPKWRWVLSLEERKCLWGHSQTAHNICNLEKENSVLVMPGRGNIFIFFVQIFIVCAMPVLQASYNFLKVKGVGINCLSPCLLDYSWLGRPVLCMSTQVASPQHWLLVCGTLDTSDSCIQLVPLQRQHFPQLCFNMQTLI